MKAAEDAQREVPTFCATLVSTGCRIAEALELTSDGVELKAGALVLETLKKRKSRVFRQVLAPPAFLDTLNLVHNLQSIGKRQDQGEGLVLWDSSRTTAWTRVCEVMQGADIELPTPEIYVAEVRAEAKQTARKMWG